jgi:hypothetical protein
MPKPLAQDANNPPEALDEPQPLTIKFAGTWQLSPEGAEADDLVRAITHLGERQIELKKRLGIGYAEMRRTAPQGISDLGNRINDLLSALQTLLGDQPAQRSSYVVDVFGGPDRVSRFGATSVSPLTPGRRTSDAADGGRMGELITQRNRPGVQPEELPLRGPTADLESATLPIVADHIRRILQAKIDSAAGNTVATLEAINSVLAEVHAPIVEVLKVETPKLSKRDKQLDHEQRRLLRDIRDLDERSRSAGPSSVRAGQHSTDDILAALREFGPASAKARIKELETLLNQFSGHDFSSFQERKSFARRLGDALRSAGCKLQCPSCDKPAYLEAKLQDRPTGYFRYTHVSAPSHGGFTNLPQFTLLTIPPRKPRSKPAGQKPGA